MPLRLVLATGNAGKAAEIGDILGQLPGIELLPRPAHVPEPAETASTLLDNARIKAAALVEATGEAAVADDTGLEVDALDGRPGVHTARFAGPEAGYDDNMAKLLSELEAADAMSPEQRRARWRTVAVIAFPDGRELWAEGTCAGTIAAERRGSQGFGYDPVFVADESDGRTFAEMSRAEKNAVSHRGRAFRALAARLVQHQPAP